MHREAIRKWLTRSRQVNRCNCITAMDLTQAFNFEVKKVGRPSHSVAPGPGPGCWEAASGTMSLRPSKVCLPSYYGIPGQLPDATGSGPFPARASLAASGSVHRDPPPPGTGPRPGPQPGRAVLGNSPLKPESEARRLPRPILATAPNNRAARPSYVPVLRANHQSDQSIR